MLLGFSSWGLLSLWSPGRGVRAPAAAAGSRAARGLRAAQQPCTRA